MDEKTAKICTRCKTEQPRENFSKNKNSKDGLSSVCKECARIRSNEYYRTKVKPFLPESKTPKPIHLNTKVCTKCLRELPLKQFDKNRCTKDGFNQWCKECKRAYHYNVVKGESVPEIRRPKEGFKFCQKCGKEKSISEFSSNGKYGYCKDCVKLYYQENKEKFTAYFAVYNKSDRHRAAVRKYRANNQERENELTRLRYQNNPRMKLDRCISKGVYDALRGNKNGLHWELFVNFTLDELIKHLESQFTSEMTWDNYGTYWEVDHIIPKKSLDYTTANDRNFKIIWGLYNLRPLSAHENRCRPKNGSGIPEKMKQEIIKKNLREGEE